MNILILGSFGFIGSNIIKYIDDKEKSKGINVIAFDRYPEHINHVKFKSITRVYAGDFSDEYLLERVFSENKIDLVVHSLSASVPSLSQDNKFDIKYNVLPTINLLNQMVKHKVKDVVFLSSGGAIYGDHYVSNTGHIEEEVLLPKSAYGVSKLTIEKYLYLYSVQHKIRCLVIRLSNPYGPYHFSQKQGIINIAIERAIDGKAFEVWGDGNGRKDYIFIEDFCAVLMKLIDVWDGNYTIINVGSGQLLSVNDIIDIIKKQINPSFHCLYKKANSLDVQDFKLDLSKMNKIIGDYKFANIEEGINKTLSWYQNIL